ncbi:hypothetical protein L596_023700 [Steinernema carpocapsae]|uniref:Uncharacterized protein n=1 Tax=Steinernema carpocapsae TaxID=34508 RepID=A0A4U5MEH7_STECR|nr:hypothetical protein L596_023700 [Steinernema carpocapsae]
MDSLPNVFYEECNALLLSMHNPFELSIVKPKVVLPFFWPWSNEMITVQLTIEPDYYEVSCYNNRGGVRFSLEEAFRHQRSFKVFRLHLLAILQKGSSNRSRKNQENHRLFPLVSRYRVFRLWRMDCHQGSNLRLPPGKRNCFQAKK